MKRKIIYVFFGLALVAFRLVFNFFFDLIPGINGGYYPLQVRAVLESGTLGFPDMPLYFYLNTAIVKCLSLFSGASQEYLIILTLKIVDSFSLPLIVIPLYLVQNHVFEIKLSRFFNMVILAFATLSLSPLILTSDLQKNAMAIPLFLFFVYFTLLFFRGAKFRHLAHAIVFLCLTGLTHFGVFSIAMLFLILSLIVYYRQKAILPIVATMITGFLIVLIFDASRAARQLHFLYEVVAPPRMYMMPVSPVEVLNYAFSWFLAGLGFYIFMNRNLWINGGNRNLVLIFSTMITILALPIINIEYARRFSLHLFIFQILMVLTMYGNLSLKLRKAISGILILITLFSMIQ